jgi:hypothetical protein
MFSSRRHERIEGFHDKLDNISEEVVGKCKKCEVKPPSKEVQFAHREGTSLIQNEFLGDNSNSPKEVLGKGRRQTITVV